MADERHKYTVKIPQDVSRPDKVLFGATVRQAVILGGAAVGLWLLWLVLQPFTPPLIFVVPAVLILLLLGIAVTAERDGISLERMLFAAIRQVCSPRRRVMAPEGVVNAPRFLSRVLHGQKHEIPAPLGLPAQTVRKGGVVDLGDDGAAVLAVCSTVNFTLRTPSEQELLVAGFAGWLNSLTGPVQITSRNSPADLTAQIGVLRAAASSLPHSLLEAAAQAHADFLAEINDTGSVLHRSLFVTFHEPDPAQAPRATRRLADAASLLAACEIDATTLDSDDALEVLNAALDPDTRPALATIGA